MTLIKKCVIAAVAGSAAGLGACAADDGYYGRSSVSIGVSSGYYDHNHYWHRGDRDGDGIPNWADNHPNNPYRP